MEQNRIAQFKEDILEYGGKILWQNKFESWTQNPQEEFVAILWGFIIYAQSKMDYLQPCWVAFEHSVSTDIQKFLKYAKFGKYFIKRSETSVHTVILLHPRDVFRLLREMKKQIEIHKVFQDVPNIRLFHFLNHMEVWDYAKDEEKVLNIALTKMKNANLGKFVPKIKFIPEPQYYAV